MGHRIWRARCVHPEKYKYRLAAKNNGVSDMNRLLTLMRKLKLHKLIHIPPCYLYGDKDTRLSLLSGIIDCNGDKLKNNGNCYQVEFIDERLRDDVIYLCRSLGLSASKKPRFSTTGQNLKLLKCKIRYN